MYIKLTSLLSAIFRLEVFSYLILILVGILLFDTLETIALSTGVFLDNFLVDDLTILLAFNPSLDDLLSFEFSALYEL